MTGKDVSDVRYAFVDTSRYPADEQPLAIDKVRYIGDEVAAVAAISEEVAEEALRLIKVNYEVLPAATTVEEALASDAPAIHEQNLEGTSAWEDWGAAEKKGSAEQRPKNVSAQTNVCFGDVEQGFAEADYVRSDRFETAATAHCALEPHAAVASYDPVTGKLDLWLSTMGIFLKRFVLSKALKLPIGKVRVRHSYVGGAFGGKIDVFPYEFCAAFLSKKCGQPVKFELSREEVFMTTRQRHPVVIEIKTGAKKDGTLVAQDIRVTVDNGGYRGSGAIIAFLCHGFSFPIYRVPNYRYEGLAVYTNNPIRGPQRGHGAPQIRFAIDSQIDLIARDLGLDPIDVMLKNVRHKGDVLPNGDVLNSCGLTDGLHGVISSMEWKSKRQANHRDGKSRYKRGLGVSLCAMFSGAMYYPFASAAMVKMHDDGSVTLFTGTQEMGQGAYTTLSQVGQCRRAERPAAAGAAHGQLCGQLPHRGFGHGPGGIFTCGYGQPAGSCQRSGTATRKSAGDRDLGGNLGDNHALRCGAAGAGQQDHGGTADSGPDRSNRGPVLCGDRSASGSAGALGRYPGQESEAGAAGLGGRGHL